MQVNRVLLLLVLLLICVCTPLAAITTSRNTRNRNRPHHGGRFKQMPIDRHRIVEKYRPKNVQIVDQADNWGLPITKTNFVASNERQPEDLIGGIIPRAPHLIQSVNHHSHDMTNASKQGSCESLIKNYKSNASHPMKCKPRLTIVHLKDTGNLVLSPSAVAVNRCDGICQNIYTNCIPIKNVTRTFYIGQQRNNKMTCVPVEVVEHTECQCMSCRKRNCGPNQVYDEDECKCKCPKNIKQNCPSNQSFDEQECKCRCKHERQCSTGSKFDQDQCSCVVGTKHQLGSPRIDQTKRKPAESL